MIIGAFKISRVHVFVFVTLTILFFLLAAHFYGILPAIIPGVEGLFCGAAAVYGAAAVVLNAKFGRRVLPIGLLT